MIKNRIFLPIRKIFRKIIAYIIIIKHSGNFWEIKNSINTMRNEKIKEVYIDAYREIMRKKSGMIGIHSHFESLPILPHEVQGIFISNSARIGKNCTIFQQVTIGSNLLPDSKGRGAPIIGDNCYIGAGAKIIGKVKIGNNCRIGANCVVFKDMPDNSVAVLPPPRIIVKSELNNSTFGVE